MSSNRAATGRKERVDYDEKESMEITTSDDVEIYTSFDSLGLKEDLLRGIYAYGKSNKRKIIANYLHFVPVSNSHIKSSMQVLRGLRQFSSVLSNRSFKVGILLRNRNQGRERRLFFPLEYYKFLTLHQTKHKL